MPPWRTRSYAPRAATSSVGPPDERRAGGALDQRRQRHLGQLRRAVPPRRGARRSAASSPATARRRVRSAAVRGTGRRRPARRCDRRPARSGARARARPTRCTDRARRAPGPARRRPGGRRRPRAPMRPRPGRATTARDGGRARRPASRRSGPGASSPGRSRSTCTPGARPSVSRSATSTPVGVVAERAPQRGQRGPQARARRLRVHVRPQVGRDQRARLPAGVQRQPRRAAAAPAGPRARPARTPSRRTRTSSTSCTSYTVRAYNARSAPGVRTDHARDHGAITDAADTRPMRNLARNAAFRRLFAGHATSLFGDRALFVVLGIWTLDLTGSTGAGGLAFGFLAIGGLAAPVAGVIADRFPRRRVLIANDLAAAVLVCALLGRPRRRRRLDHLRGRPRLRLRAAAGERRARRPRRRARRRRPAARRERPAGVGAVRHPHRRAGGGRGAVPGGRRCRRRAAGCRHVPRLGGLPGRPRRARHRRARRPAAAGRAGRRHPPPARRARRCAARFRRS